MLNENLLQYITTGPEDETVLTVPVNQHWSTSGKGYWSDSTKGATVTSIAVSGYEYDDDQEYTIAGEANVYFDPNSWNERTDGLIYTDPLFLNQFRKFLISLGVPADIANTVHYSEQGMQGDDYVHFDAYELAEYIANIRIIGDIASLEQRKTEVVKNLLGLMKRGGFKRAEKMCKFLRDAGVNWKELETIERSIMSKNLNESIADKPSINFKIERALKAHDPAMQIKLLDALELVKDAGDAGIDVADWAAKIKQLYPDEDFSMGDLLKTAVKDFGCCVKRLGDKRYGWSEEDDNTPVDADPMTRAAMGGQMQIAKITMDAMKQLGEFTAEELGAAVARATGIPASVATQYAQSVIDQFAGDTLSKVGDRYKIRVAKQKTAGDHVADLKNLLKNAGLGPKN